MTWKCINDVYNEKNILLFVKGKFYDEQDDRGDADDIAICICDELGFKRYLADQFVRNNFVEISDVIELLKNNIHDEVIAGGQNEKYFKNYWTIWWGLMNSDCKRGILKTFEEIKNNKHEI
jgi:hypothetical protein